jgi:hypothetical protein
VIGGGACAWPQDRIGIRDRYRDLASPYSSPQFVVLLSTLINEKVDVFGGSAAYGFFDPERDSYLQRAFSARAGATNVNYQYINHTVVGGTAFVMEKQHPGQFEAHMKKDKPQVVVFSWGLLNDISSRHKVSVDTFGNAVKTQIAEALAAHAVVLIVTPPVTEESATHDHTKIETYINKLFSVAELLANDLIQKFGQGPIRYHPLPT